MDAAEKVKRIWSRSETGKLLRGGHLRRPKVCGRCGLERKLEIHHRDYDRPDLIEWFCKPCHERIHSSDPTAESSADHRPSLKKNLLAQIDAAQAVWEQKAGLKVKRTQFLGLVVREGLAAVSLLNPTVPSRSKERR